MNSGTLTVKVKTKGSPMARCFFTCFDISVHDDGNCVVWATDTDGKAYSEEFTSGSYLIAVERNMDAQTFYKEHMDNGIESEFEDMIDQGGHNPTVYGSMSEMKAAERGELDGLPEREMPSQDDMQD